jgi:formamidopyrimidine-DNA glycosylase
MPELPEVETIRRGLAPFLEGASLTSVETRRADLRFPFPARFAERLRGKAILRLGRRAKYLLAELSGGETLAIHLGMTGRFTMVSDGRNGGADQQSTPGAFYYAGGPDPRHDHVIFGLSHGGALRYNDVRRFGYMELVPSAERDAHPLFHALGVEPLSESLNARYLAQKAAAKSQPLKAFLLDQRVIAGLGNIYVSEALFRAKLSPFAPASELAASPAAAKRLCRAVKAVLEDAIRAGGSTLRDYRQADGSSGGFQEQFYVYARDGEACPEGCGSVIQRATQQGRSTFFCPVCQKA